MVADLRLIVDKTTESNHLLNNKRLPLSWYFSTAVNLSWAGNYFGRIFDIFEVKMPDQWESIKT
jgi:hypothetical protein